jgi:hypothetical protein
VPSGRIVAPVITLTTGGYGLLITIPKLTFSSKDLIRT